MNIATVLRVFKNSSLITEQGEFKISRVFDNAGAANKARYHYHCTENGIAIYARNSGKGKPAFAVIDQQTNSPPVRGYFTNEKQSS